jgi:hypothetical protein
MSLLGNFVRNATSTSGLLSRTRREISVRDSLIHLCITLEAIVNKKRLPREDGGSVILLFCC